MNALGQQTTCKICMGKGFVRTQVDGYPFIKRCSCQKSRLRHQVLQTSGLPPKFWNTTLAPSAKDGREPFVPYGGPNKRGITQADKTIAQNAHKEALSVCRKLKTLYVNHFINGDHTEDLYGLLLYGKPGRGKTRLICSLLRDLIDEGLHDVKFVEYNQLFKQIRASFGTNGPNYSDIFGPLLNASVLAIDDLGTEVTGSTVFLLDQMGYIINERYNKNLPTLFTCNDWVSIKDSAAVGTANDMAGNDQNFEDIKSFEYKKFFQQKKMEEKARAELERQVDALQQRVSTRLRSRICEMCLELKIEGFDYRGRIGRNRELRMVKEVRDMESGR